MKLILVDPYVKRVYPVEVGRKLTIEVIYKILNCSEFEAHNLFCNKAKHAFYCDGEGTLKRPPLPCLFLEGYKYPIFGRLLIFKPTGDGEESTPTISVEEVFSLVFFLP